MNRLVAVGDIHGCSQTLAALLKRIDLEPGDTLLSTGDLSSKGEDSQGVHDQLVELEERGVNLILLLGNHELMLLAMQRLVGADVDLTKFPESVFEGADVSFLVRDNETWATLKSYGIEGAEDPQYWAFRYTDPQEHFESLTDQFTDLNWELPQSHLDLLSRCQTHHIERNCLFVHSGILPKFLQMANAHDAVEAQLQEDARALFWTREGLGERPSFPELIVHGHTPLPYLHTCVADTSPWRDEDLVFKSVIHNGTLNLDSGVFLEAGHLTAVEIPEDGNPANFEMIRVSRRDPVCKDRLWHFNFM
ncbi:metallophosphoesterase [Thalassoroseus pseudoceratinae]|uniref:metallophosphoesterase n=1 Tax=Thalassoroseus pseudoceratinae TaxID=2713176 RepID=UPI00141F7FC5|nr:metallophosphoesterase [Thalassoroseus pseudoceratinae]